MYASGTRSHRLATCAPLLSLSPPALLTGKRHFCLLQASQWGTVIDEARDAADDHWERMHPQQRHEWVATQSHMRRDALEWDLQAGRYHEHEAHGRRMLEYEHLQRHPDHDEDGVKLSSSTSLLRRFPSHMIIGCGNSQLWKFDPDFDVFARSMIESFRELTC